MLAVLVLAIALSACGSEANENATDDAPSANGAPTVSLKLIAFKPENLTVPAGTAVTWDNADQTDHTVTSGKVDQQGGTVTSSGDGRFDSGVLTRGGTFSFTFSEPGSYAYFCKLHPATMRGQITVT